VGLLKQSGSERESDIPVLLFIPHSADED
jgi:hypothetical protein